MTGIAGILYTILIQPIIYIFQIAFTLISKMTWSKGAAILGISVLVNLLTAPLYKRADEMQDEERAAQERLKAWTMHIRKVFHGDERFMMLSAYYRQQHYHPLYALRSSVSLLLQIPFFIAAYAFLTSGRITGSFLFIADMGKEDQLLKIGSVSINVLPLLMTLINLLAAEIYTKGLPVKNKAQLYLVALFFLLFLYHSPSGLLLYWTMNNVFSLVRIVQKKYIRLSQRALCFIGIGTLDIFFIILLFGRTINSGKKLNLFICAVIFVQLLTVFLFLQNRYALLQRFSSALGEKDGVSSTLPYFLSGIAVLTALMGILIPTALISASPVEFVNIYEYHHPLEYAFWTFLVFAGYFGVWFSIYYYMSDTRGKRRLAFLSMALAEAALITYMFFGKNIGTISADLQFASLPSFSLSEKLCNLIALFFGLLLLGLAVYGKWKIPICRAYIVALTAILLLSGKNVAYSLKKLSDESYVKQMTLEKEEDQRILPLSRQGKNVVVIMLDAAIGALVPYIFEERPDLYETYAGFTFYPNTMSYGMHTMFGSPALFGGYEYSLPEIQRRKEVSLVEKQNEAVSVMPALFSGEGYRVTVCDPPYVGYQYYSDLSIYDAYENVHAHHMEGVYFMSDAESASDTRRDNFVLYSMFKTTPLVVQMDFYSGTIDQTRVVNNAAYRILANMDKLMDITDAEENTFMMMVNNLTHEPVLLQPPEYVLTEAAEDAVGTKREHARVLDERILKFSESAYDVNMAALLRLGEWFEYLREEGVYDNTRIILAADHGKGDCVFKDMSLKNGLNIAEYNPLLMVKDFDGKDFQISDEFMTNADVPTMALEGLINNPSNPFTGKAVDSKKKYQEKEQVLNTAATHNIYTNNGNVFDTTGGQYYGVNDNVLDPSNWRLIGETMNFD